MLNVKIFLPLLIFLVIGWFLLTYRILEVPPGINGDEAAIGYNAALVAKTGHDQNGRFLPLFVSTLDLTDWKQPITFYSEVLAFKVFGLSYFNFRAVSVVIILISGVVIFALVKEILGFQAGIISLFIFLTIPSVVIQSHLVLENIAPIPFIAVWLLSLAKYQKTYKTRYLILGAVILGASLFSYPGMRLIVPVMFFLSLGFIWYVGRNKFKYSLKELAIFFMIFLIFPVFMLSLKNVYPGAILAYNRPQLVASYQEFFLPILSAFDWSFLFLKGDVTPYHSTGRQGVFLLATFPLFILGIITILRKKEPMQYLILASFFLMPVLYGLTGSGSIYRSSRMLAFLPSFTVITTVGLATIISFKNKSHRNILMLVIISLITLNFFDFMKDYLYSYPLRIQNQFAKPMHLAFAKASQLVRQDHFKPYIQDNLSSENEIATNFFKEIYFPEGITSFSLENQIPPQSVMIISGSSIPQNQKKPVQKYNVGTDFFTVVENR